MTLSQTQNSSVAGSVRLRLVLQLLATTAVLAWVPGNGTKLLVMMLVWAVGFGRISRAELMMMIGVNLLFIGMNYGALREGVFRFSNPDALGMPVYEFFMWGFYILNTVRFLGGTTPEGKWWLAILMAAAFAIPFSTVSDAGLLTLFSAIILLIGIALYHEPMDLAYITYMVIMGVLIEYVGVWSGQWSYPGSPFGGVPLWFITMWGGVGLFTRRLLLPILRRSGRAVAR